MGSLYRSEPMTLCQLFLQPESAYSCVSELGELGLVQFKDLNKDVNAFQRKFVNEVRRCEEMERKLRFLENEIKKDKIVINDTGDNPDAPAIREITDIEAHLEQLENEMKEVNSNYEALKNNYSDLTELKHILSKTNHFFEEVSHYQRHHDVSLLDPNAGHHDNLESVGLLQDDSFFMHRISFGSTSRPLCDQFRELWKVEPVVLEGVMGILDFVAGVMVRDRLPAFERMLWRACRGNVLLRYTDIDQSLEHPLTGLEVYKSVFLIFFQGDQLKTKVKKIVEGFHGTLYPCPETQAERREMAMGVVTRIEDLKTVLHQTEEHRYRVLLDAAMRIRVWTIKVCKMKAIYHTLNQFSGGSSSNPAGSGGASLSSSSQSPKSLIGECWCPVKQLDIIQQGLRRGTERSGSGIASVLNRIETKESPPTYNETNKYTSVFQSIIDAYGVANYREINPAPFAIVTFPFLFSVMFGDIGHGLMMFLGALALVLFERKLMLVKIDSEMWTMLFGGRYIILLMGAFSIYSGLIYNDIFAKSFDVFGSAWYPSPQNYTAQMVHKNSLITLDPTPRSDYDGSPYPFGVDPIWSLAKNKISFLNSFKMKTSVVFGISQMMFGVILSLQNHRFNNDRISIICEFIPQVIFLMSIFGYLIVLIFYKWIAYGAANAACAPSLLIGLINMFLLNYPSPESSSCSVLTFYAGQKSFQTFLLVLAVICVPWILLPKPLLLRRAYRKRMRSAQWSRTGVVQANFEMQSGRDDLSVQSGDIHLHFPEGVHSEEEQYQIGHDDHSHHEEFDFGEVFMHQCIHTIEYCLNCISHTASYLRLWALSLAHAQLSEVLWNMILHIALTFSAGYGGSLAIFVLFAPWAALTVAILLCMEGLSVFLHTLRLHWVEFQSKFYRGEGYPFEPFSFKNCLSGSLEDEVPTVKSR